MGEGGGGVRHSHGLEVGVHCLVDGGRAGEGCVEAGEQGEEVGQYGGVRGREPRGGGGALRRLQVVGGGGAGKGLGDGDGSAAGGAPTIDAVLLLNGRGEGGERLVEGLGGGTHV